MQKFTELFQTERIFKAFLKAGLVTLACYAVIIFVVTKSIERRYHNSITTKGALSGNEDSFKLPPFTAAKIVRELDLEGRWQQSPQDCVTALTDSFEFESVASNAIEVRVERPVAFDSRDILRAWRSLALNWESEGNLHWKQSAPLLQSHIEAEETTALLERALVADKFSSADHREETRLDFLRWKEKRKSTGKDLLKLRIDLDSSQEVLDDSNNQLPVSNSDEFIRIIRLGFWVCLITSLIYFLRKAVLPPDEREIKKMIERQNEAPPDY